MRFLLPSLVAAAIACAAPLAAQHGTLSERSAVGADTLCEHDVPASVCVRCHPELAARFQEAGDWCRPHRVPESQCHRCHPDLCFEPLPAVPEGADYSDLTTAQVLVGLEPHAIAGKVTVFDFWAAWCAPCRNFDADLRTLTASDPRVAVRRIDIGGWEGPLVERYMPGVEELPFVIVLGPDGQRLGTIEGVNAASLGALIAPALAAVPSPGVDAPVAP